MIGCLSWKTYHFVGFLLLVYSLYPGAYFAHILNTFIIFIKKSCEYRVSIHFLGAFTFMLLTLLLKEKKKDFVRWGRVNFYWKDDIIMIKKFWFGVQF